MARCARPAASAAGSSRASTGSRSCCRRRGASAAARCSSRTSSCSASSCPSRRSSVRSSWRVRRFLWAPRLGCHGIQRLTLLRDVLVLSGAGVGGGSLVYANVLYEPPSSVWEDPSWAEELRPYYDLARRMLGATETPFT